MCQCLPTIQNWHIQVHNDKIKLLVLRSTFHNLNGLKSILRLLDLFWSNVRKLHIGLHQLYRIVVHEQNSILLLLWASHALTFVDKCLFGCDVGDARKGLIVFLIEYALLVFHAEFAHFAWWVKVFVRLLYCLVLFVKIIGLIRIWWYFLEVYALRYVHLATFGCELNNEGCSYS